jgi:multidrug transporter EmrE-like cation transporter
MSGTGFALVLLTAAMTMGANLMLRAGIDAAGGFSAAGPLELARAVLGLFLQPVFTAGFITYFLASVVWFRVVATEPLSLAYPVLVSLTFTLVTAGAVVLFHEPLTWRKVVGLAVILAGILLVSIEKGPA